MRDSLFQRIFRRNTHDNSESGEIHRRYQTERRILIACSLLVMAWLGRELGPVLNSFARLAAFGIYLVLLVRQLYFTWDETRSTMTLQRVMGLFMCCLALILLWLSDEPSVSFLSVPSIALGLYLIKPDHWNAIYLLEIAMGSTLALMLVSFEVYFVGLARWLQSIAVFLSSAVTRVFGAPLQLGVSTSGLRILLFGFFMLVSHWILSQRRETLRFVLGGLSLLAGQQVFFLLLRFIPYFWTDITIANAAALFLLVTVAIVTFFSHESRLDIRLPNRKVCPKWVALGCVILFVATLLGEAHISERTALSYKVLVDGRQSAVSFDVPAFEDTEEGLLYGPVQGVSIGSFVEYLNIRGHTVDVLSDIAHPELLSENPPPREPLEASDLAGYDILVLMNLAVSISQVERGIITDFVTNGGGLLILGDHTSMFVDPVDFAQGRDYFNELLAPTGIRFRVDSAEPTGMGWKGKLDLSNWLMDLSSYSAMEIGISVGASLVTRGAAVPIVTGRYAFSDQANPLMPGYLGNREYELGEHVGDLTLVAAQKFGDGRIVVFGDTSGFQYLSIARTHRFVGRVFSWLSSNETVAGGIAYWVSRLGLIVGAILYLALAFRSPFVLFALTLAVLLGSVAGVIFWGFPSQQLKEIDPLGDSIPYAIIDTGHNPLANLKGYTGDSLDGLVINIRRNGAVALFETITSPLAKDAKLILIVAPSRPLDTNGVQDLLSFAERGGHVVISAGYERLPQISSLLSKVGIQILNIPLGPVPYLEESDDTSSPRFTAAFPITWAESSTKSLYSVTIDGEEYCLVTHTPIGQGGVTLIADQGFLLNDNLEEPIRSGGLEWAHWPGNVSLLQSLLNLVPLVGEL